MELAEAAEATSGGLWEAAEGKERAEVVEALRKFQDRLAGVKVLDPACGSGNFLYTALRLLLDLEAEVRATLRTLTGQMQPVKVSPRQMLGLERSEYAHEIWSFGLDTFNGSQNTGRTSGTVLRCWIYSPALRTGTRY